MTRPIAHVCTGVDNTIKPFPQDCCSCCTAGVDLTAKELCERMQSAREELREAKKEIARYRDGMDGIYNHGDIGRSLVINYFGTLHPNIEETPS